MLIFDFLKKFFGWVDETPRKRRAVSFSLEKEFVSSKKQCCNHEIIDLEDEPIEIKNDSDDDDDVQIIIKHKSSPANPFSRVNGKCKSREKSFNCSKSSFVSPPKREPCCDKLNMGYFENARERVQNVNKHHQCLTLNKTHRLREKNQYEELLQNFLPHRIHVMCDKREENGQAQEPPEVIDLEKFSFTTPSSKTQPISRKYDSSGSCWNASSKERKQRNKEIVITLDNDKTDDVLYSVHDKKPSPNKSSSSEKSTQNKSMECVAKNTLRDHLAAKAVMREDFVPQITKRYNERIEQRYKEAEELKKMTCMLSKHNRLAREAALEEHLARSMRLCEAVLDESEKLEESELPTLTEKMLQEVRNALIPRPPDEILVENFGLRITRKDIHTLADLNWLNDEVINFYMNLLIARSANDKYPKVHAMNTFFYPKLINGGYASLKRWTKKVDIFAQDLIVVPIHLGIHWCMSIIDFRDKTINYYDSMGGSNPKCLSALRQYLENESLDKKKQTYDTSNWKLESVKNIPLQMNGSDCGVFSCMFAEYICANKKITFTQQDMPYFRNKMVYEILKSKLL